MQWRWMLVVAVATVGCTRKQAAPVPSANAVVPEYFRVDPATAGSITGAIRYAGAKLERKPIDMTGDPACVEAHPGKAFDETLVVGTKGGLGNAFVYVKSGLEGKKFAVPTAAVTIDQRGCWFRPRVMGLQVGQTFEVINSDPVTHNIHPMAVANRAWNHSQGPGDAPMHRKFGETEVMIPVKCNIHSWMRAYVGVLDHSYFAVSADDGSFAIRNLPPGNYTLGVWQEKLGTQEKQVTVTNQSSSVADFTFKGK